MSSIDYIIVGLGNPGRKYEKTRHNVGFMVLDHIANELGVQINSDKFKSLCAQAEFGDKKILLLKPQTFMNDSGVAVHALLSYYGLLPKTMGLFSKKDADLNEVLTVIQDDIDIDLGRWKIASDSRSGGHRGIQSIINHLKTQKFRRLKIGVKNELLRTKIPPEKFVLQNFSPEEKETLKEVLKEALKNIG